MYSRMSGAVADPVLSPGLLVATSREEALDWALVLLSQGIEAIVVAQGPEWTVVVDPGLQAVAEAQLRQYRLENTRDLPRPHRTVTAPAFEPAVLGWTLLLALAYLWNAVSRDDLLLAGRLDAARVWLGEVFRMVTATTLHLDLAHLAGNLVFGTLLLGCAMARWGVGVALAAALLGGVGGNALAVLLDSRHHLSVGASGVVMAALALLAFTPRSTESGGVDRPPWITRGLGAVLWLFLLLGLDPSSDVLAHLGGFATGLAIAWGLGRLPACVFANPYRQAGLLLASLALILSSWFRALHP